MRFTVKSRARRFKSALHSALLGWRCIFTLLLAGTIFACLADRAHTFDRYFKGNFSNPILPWNGFGATAEAPKELLKACVVYLMIGAKTGVQTMANTLEQFDTKISAPLKHRYPAVVIHDGWATNKIQEKLRLSAKKSQVLFQFINTSDTAWMLANPEKYQIAECAFHGRSYRDMNRVFIRLMFESPIIKQFDYWMRLDLDITIKSQINVDPFALMEDGGFDFGYVQCLRGWSCNAGLSKYFESYAAGMNVSDPQFFREVKSRGLLLYGNVGIGRVALFTSPQYLRFARHMDENGGILRHRWDDQHTYAAAVALFSNYKRMKAFTFEMLPFYHKGARLDVKPCF
jgi:Glycolipid 2-alpha-mannosyltransferase